MFKDLALSPWTEENEAKVNEKRREKGRPPIQPTQNQIYHLRQATHAALTNSGGYASAGLLLGVRAPL